MIFSSLESIHISSMSLLSKSQVSLFHLHLRVLAQTIETQAALCPNTSELQAQLEIT